MVKAHELLEIWGLRTTGTSLKSAGLRSSIGGVASAIDAAVFACQYVESTAGFRVARPVLLHVYGYGEPMASLYWRGPGETRVHALSRLGWLQWLDRLDTEIPGLVRCEFVQELEARLRSEPFIVPQLHETGAVHEIKDHLPQDQSSRVALSPETESLRVRYYR